MYRCVSVWGAGTRLKRVVCCMRRKWWCWCCVCSEHFRAGERCDRLSISLLSSCLHFIGICNGGIPVQCLLVWKNPIKIHHTACMSGAWRLCCGCAACPGCSHRQRVCLLCDCSAAAMWGFWNHDHHVFPNKSRAMCSTKRQDMHLPVLLQQSC